jgi:hypothetical protein
MSPLEKIIDEIEHLDTPTTRFVEIVVRDEEYQKAKSDEEKWKVIFKISQKFIDVFNDGEYEDLIKIFKNRYPNLLVNK